MTDHPMSNPVSVDDDLVERLRKSALPSEFRRANPTLSDSALAFRHSFDAALKLEAASQLAALRHDNSDLLAAADADAFTIAALEAQLKAAREALEMIAGLRPCPDNLLGNPDIARAALNPKAPEVDGDKPA